MNDIIRHIMFTIVTLRVARPLDISSYTGLEADKWRP